MSAKTWTLPHARPIVDNRPAKGQIVGILVIGCALGLLLAWAGSTWAESQRQPDPLNESGGWQVLVPSPGQIGISYFDSDRGALLTGCGEFPFSYMQNGVSLTFTALPPLPKDCVGSAAHSHTWFVGELAGVASFTPAEFWEVSDAPTITLLNASGQALLTLTVDPNDQNAD